MSEHRECRDCYHQGVSDESRDVAACHYCGATQHISCEDHCTTCNQSNFMGAACPRCDGVYVLLEEGV